ncbi:unnamed protein product [Clonostachys byssicola]|uniref:Globin-sensor domain-containing protein n=1 Tax=Clonostachys byssicola TaxID=160290 RepID=A0A9N9Y3X1_9HYPO|nr:unnamed protein product [Clonostachys byssicola]
MAQPRLFMTFSREEIYTNLETRIHYLHSFIDFSSKDIEALIGGAKYVKALIPAVVNIVYKKLLQYDITARAFTTRSTSFEGPMDVRLTEDSPHIQHRKMFMRAYLNKLCSDPSRMEFWEYLDKVGMMHVGLGRAHPLHVEYIHLGMTLALIQDIMNEAILSHPRLALPRKIAIIKALNKVIWIQNDLLAKWQVKDADEFRNEDEEIVIEKEGYVNGVKILRTDDDGSSGEESRPESPSSRIPRPSTTGVHPVPPPGLCPFASMVDGLDLDGREVPATPPPKPKPYVAPRLAGYKPENFGDDKVNPNAPREETEQLVAPEAW